MWGKIKSALDGAYMTAGVVFMLVLYVGGIINVSLSLPDPWGVLFVLAALFFSYAALAACFPE